MNTKNENDTTQAITKQKKPRPSRKIPGAIVGRPPIYTQELADRICQELALGKSLRKVHEQNEWMPDLKTVFSWFRTNPEFVKQYELAKTQSAEALNEVIMDLGDEALELSQKVDFRKSNAVVQAVKLKSDNLKWYMSKMKPKKYGEKVDLTSDGKALPQPIINLAQIRNGEISANNSNNQDSQIIEAN